MTQDSKLSYWDLRWLVLLGANLFLLFAQMLFNEAAGALKLHLYLGGLALVFPAVLMPSAAGWWAVAIPALFCDTASPLPYGATLTVWSAIWLLLRLARGHIDPKSTLQISLLAQAANALAFAALQVWAARQTGAFSAGTAVLAGLNFFCSALAVWGLGLLFFRGQRALCRAIYPELGDTGKAIA